MHTQLTKEDRKAIDHYLRLNWSIKNIAKVIHKDLSAIYREIERNSDDSGNYHYGEADRQSSERRLRSKQGQKKISHHLALQIYIIVHLKQRYSPEQIAGILKFHQTNLPTISAETIYQWLYIERRDLIPCLCYKKNKYRHKRGTNIRAKRRRLINIRPIGERPDIINQKQRLGDFEGDTIIGKNKKTRILTHTERVSGYGLATLLLTTTEQLIGSEVIKKFQQIKKKKRLSITYDNGVEFGLFDKRLEEALHIAVYRANPYHSWERGCNENFNGLIRRFFPKGTDFAILKKSDVDRVIRLLNHRPRKRLNYLTPHQVFVLGMNPKSFAFQARM